MYIGGDSAGSNAWMIQSRKDSKIFRLGPFLFGYAGSFRMGQLLRWSIAIPVQDSRVSDGHYMCTTFIDAVRKCLKDGGFAKCTDGEETGGTFLVGYKGALYAVEEDYQVGSTLDNYSAVGIGYMTALGSLYTSKGQSPRQRIRTALLASEHVNNGVRRPFRIMSL